MPITMQRKGIRPKVSGKMGINVTQTMNGYQFENRENLRNTAKEILKRQGVSAESSQNVINQTIFDSADSSIYSNAQLSILKASAQISLSGNLKETLKYLKNNPVKKNEKQPILGELWDLFESDKNSEHEIIDLEIDYSAKNIFAAA